MQENSRKYFFGKEIFDLLPIAIGERTWNDNVRREREYCPDYFTIHYIVDGELIMNNDGQEDVLTGGDLYLTRPGDIFQMKVQGYVRYIWVKFRGKTAEALMDLPALHKVDGTPLMNAVTRSTEDGAYEEYVVGELYLLISNILKGETRGRDYIRRIKSYIHDHPTGNISVQEIAKLLNLNRRYLSTMFRRETGVSIQEYILKRKVRNAKKLLEQGHSVSECAVMTGYANIYTFSKAFKMSTGKTPTEYIRESQNESAR